MRPSAGRRLEDKEQVKARTKEVRTRAAKVKVKVKARTPRARAKAAWEHSEKEEETGKNPSGRSLSGKRKARLGVPRLGNRRLGENLNPRFDQWTCVRSRGSLRGNAYRRGSGSGLTMRGRSDCLPEELL